MKIGKKLFSLLGTALLATAVAWNFGGATEVQAASYTVNSSVSDVQGNVGDVINLPIHIESTQKLRGLSGKLRGNYDKNVIIVSDNISSILDTLDDYIIFHKGKVVVTGDKKDLYNEDLYKYIKCPKIIEFIKMVKDKDINLSNYLDINELIKGIYRSVEGK